MAWLFHFIYLDGPQVPIGFGSSSGLRSSVSFLWSVAPLPSSSVLPWHFVCWFPSPSCLRPCSSFGFLSPPRSLSLSSLLPLGSFPVLSSCHGSSGPVFSLCLGLQFFSSSICLGFWASTATGFSWLQSRSTEKNRDDRGHLCFGAPSLFLGPGPSSFLVRSLPSLLVSSLLFLLSHSLSPSSCVSSSLFLYPSFSSLPSLPFSGGLNLLGK